MVSARIRIGRGGQAHCPLCRDPVEEAETCLGCQVSYHGDCLEELGGCATLGCARQGQGVASGPERAEAEETEAVFFTPEDAARLGDMPELMQLTCPACVTVTPVLPRRLIVHPICRSCGAPLDMSYELRRARALARRPWRDREAPLDAWAQEQQLELYARAERSYVLGVALFCLGLLGALAFGALLDHPERSANVFVGVELVIPICFVFVASFVQVARGWTLDRQGLEIGQRRADRKEWLE